VAWSRIFEGTAVIVTLNTHGLEPRSAEVTVDAKLHPEGSSVSVLYRGDWDDEQLKRAKGTQTLPVKHYPSGRATITVDLPPAGMAIMV
jgi:hypothetical protein